jgi:hypothetical protein
MKKLVLLFLFVPLICFSQNNQKEDALEYQNVTRSYYDLPPLSLSKTLNEKASLWAETLAIKDSLFFSPDDYGELLYYTEKGSEFYLDNTNTNWFLDASIGWVIAGSDSSEFKQINCFDCLLVGFGIAENEDRLYVVAKYDYIHSENEEEEEEELIGDDKLNKIKSSSIKTQVKQVTLIK